MASESTAIIKFADRRWTIKHSLGPIGPGPNVFSAGNVTLDSKGRLTLHLAPATKGWTCAEVVGLGSFGYGTYRWRLATSVDQFDPAVVLGMFTWSDAPAQANRELDIEFSRWGQDAAAVTGGFSVQAAGAPGFRFAPTSGASEHTLAWTPGRVQFHSQFGSAEHRWSYQGADVPTSGGEVAPRMNLWLFRGASPKKPHQVVFENFRYTPV